MLAQISSPDGHCVFVCVCVGCAEELRANDHVEAYRGVITGMSSLNYFFWGLDGAVSVEGQPPPRATAVEEYRHSHHIYLSSRY